MSTLVYKIKSIDLDESFVKAKERALNGEFKAKLVVEVERNFANLLAKAIDKFEAEDKASRAFDTKESKLDRLKRFDSLVDDCARCNATMQIMLAAAISEPGKISSLVEMLEEISKRVNKEVGRLTGGFLLEMLAERIRRGDKADGK